jgi:hypothetical protein
MQELIVSTRTSGQARTRREPQNRESSNGVAREAAAGGRPRRRNPLCFRGNRQSAQNSRIEEENSRYSRALVQNYVRTRRRTAAGRQGGRTSSRATGAFASASPSSAVAGDVQITAAISGKCGSIAIVYARSGVRLPMPDLEKRWQTPVETARQRVEAPDACLRDASLPSEVSATARPALALYERSVGRSPQAVLRA